MLEAKRKRRILLQLQGRIELQNVQVSDTTGDASSNAAGYIISVLYLKPPSIYYHSFTNNFLLRG